MEGKSEESAMEELVRRLRERGHPFPESAAAFMTGGSEISAGECLKHVDEPPLSGEWKALPHPGLLSRPRTVQRDYVIPVVANENVPPGMAVVGYDDEGKLVAIVNINKAT